MASARVVSRAEAQQTFISPSRWAAQQVFHRPLSKSPNARDRTPIRRRRPEMSRHRSSSRSEALLAYAAEERARQNHPDQVQVMRSPFTSNLMPLPQSYQTQQYSFPQAGSPYLQQPSYFDSAGQQHGYVNLPIQQEPTQSASVYNSARMSGMQMTQMSGTTLNPTETLYSQPAAPQLPSVSALPSNFPPIPQPLESTQNEPDAAGNRQKPQCWDHGCNGRQFSTFSNLLRHQREKSGTASKARCPHCGTEFTRTTARNGHLYGGKCKGMPDQSKDPPDEAVDDVP